MSKKKVIISFKKKWHGEQAADQQAQADADRVALHQRDDLRQSVEAWERQR